MLHKMLRNFTVITMVLFCKNSVSDEEHRGCLSIPSTPDLKKDGQALCSEIAKGSIDKSFEGINGILCWRTFEQRKQTVEAFRKECKDHNLLDEIKKLQNISDKMANLIEFMLSSPMQIYATIIQNIASGVYDDNGLITFIVCSFNNDDKPELAYIFSNVSTVLADYGNKHGEEYKRTLLDICWAPRRVRADPAVTDEIVDKEVKCLKERNGEDFMKTAKEIIRKYSNHDLKRILDKYSCDNQPELGDKISEIFPPMEKEVYATLTRSVQYLPMFYAKLLHHFIKGEPINGEFHAINYIITIQTEDDLENIFREYRKFYNNADLFNDIQERFGTDKPYCEAIKILVGLCPSYSTMSVKELTSEDYDY